MKNPQSLHHLYQQYILTVLSFSVCFLGILWLAYEYKVNQQDLEKMENEYMEEQKKDLRTVIETLVSGTRYRLSLSRQQTEEILQNKIQGAFSVMESLYGENKDNHSQDQIKQHITGALMASVFADGKGYFWIIDLNHTMVAHPFNKDLIGKNQEQLTDKQGKKFIQEFVQTALKHEQGGFVSYYWGEPGVPSALHKEKGRKKIAFVKLFKPYNWVIGAGLYQEDIEEKIQQDVLHRLDTFRHNKTGYIFTHTFDGICLTHINKDLIGKNRWQLKNQNNRKIVQELDRTGRQDHGGFLEYIATINPVTGKPSKKLSYVLSIDEWQWVVGTGIYLDAIEKKLLNLRKTNKKRMLVRLVIALIIILCAFTASYIISSFLAKKLQHELLVFIKFFSQASKKHIKIDPRELQVKEFRKLAIDANAMIEEQEKTKSSVFLAKNEWERTFDAIPDMIFILNSDMKIIRFNKALADALPETMKEILHQPCYKIIHDTDNPPKTCSHCHMRQNKQIHSHEFYEEKFGKHLHSTIAPLFNEQNTFLGSVHILRDISQQKESEQKEKEFNTKVQRMQKMQSIGTLAGGIAHDFNNILTAIIGYSEIAKLGLPANNPVQNDLDQILISGKRATELVQQILTFSRKSGEELKPIKVQFVIKEAIKLLRSTLPTTISFKQHIDKNCPAVLADTTKIHQIVMNLCTNARHAIGNNKGTIEVSLEQMADQQHPEDQEKIEQFVVLTVKDSGKGMDKTTEARIFEPYFTTKKQGEGTGLGLAVTHGIIEECGGRIEVITALGEGTTFHIYLPVIAEEETPATDQKNSLRIQGGKEHILFIDDEPAITTVCQAILTNLGYRVTTEIKSMDALTRFRANPETFDLVITDQTMPDLTGAELAQAMLKLNPELPIILCTGYTSAISEEDTLALGIKRFISKPLDRNMLAEVIRNVLDDNQKS